MSDQPKKRGAPLGNTNALKHGFYSRSFTHRDRLDLNRTGHTGEAGEFSLDDEIVLLRVMVRKAIGRFSECTPAEASDLLRSIAICINTLTRSSKANRDITLEQQNKTYKDLVMSVIHDVQESYGITEGTFEASD